MRISSPVRTRVLMTADSVGGVWNHSLEMIRGLTDCDVYLVVFGGRLSTRQRREVDASPARQVIESGLRLEWMDSPWDDVAQSVKFLQAISREIAPDVIHFNSYSFADSDWDCPVVVGAHSCVLSWWRAVKRSDPPTWLDPYRERVSRGLAAADVVVAPTRAMLDSLRENYPEANFDGRVISNGMEGVSRGRSERTPRILSAGRLWDEAKNVSLLESIAARVDAPIFVAGRSERAMHRLHALGSLAPEALHEEMRRSLIYAAPALYEPFGLAVLEAALCGCVLVLSDIPSFRENWDGAACFVDPCKPSDWRSALNSLIADPEVCGRLALKSHRRAARFTRDAMTETFFSLYRDLATPALTHAL